MGARGPKTGWKGFRRNKLIAIRLTSKEHQALSRIARASGETPSEYVRSLLKGVIKIRRMDV